VADYLNSHNVFLWEDNFARDYYLISGLVQNESVGMQANVKTIQHDMLSFGAIKGCYLPGYQKKAVK
jgi:hypothetical protein